MPNVNKTIELSHDLNDKYDEGRVGATSCKPGMLLARETDGDLIPHATAGGWADPMIAIEDSLQGKTIDGTYATGEVIRIKRARQNQKYCMRLAASQTIAIGDRLVSNGDGSLKESNGTTDKDLFVAEEAVTTTGTPDWVKCRVL